MKDKKFEDIVFAVLLTAIFIAMTVRIYQISNDLETIKNELMSKYVITPEEYE